MSPDYGDIALFWAGIINGNILLDSKSKLIIMSGFDSTGPLSDVLTPGCVLNDAKMGHVFLKRQD